MNAPRPRLSEVSSRVPALEGRRFLFVTMPFGPFSRRLARSLAARGGQVRRVVMNSGDLLDWGATEAFRFESGPSTWPAWLEATARSYDATDLVVFGDSTVYAAAGGEVGRKLGSRVWVLENGYFRPHWITLERSGVNATSTLPRDPAVYLADELDPPPPAEAIGSITPHHVGNIIRYFAAMILGRFLFPRYAYPFSLGIGDQIAGHVKRFALRMFDGGRHAARVQESVLSNPASFFLVCLQREGDSQIVRHSAYGTNAAFLNHVLASFAAHAPAGTRLVVKNHPLDPGIENLERKTREIATRYGVEDRVVFIDGGSLAALARASEGLLTVNSTAGLAVLGFRRPVKLLGEAFFDLPGLTDQQRLEDFWTRPTAPNHDLYLKFRRFVFRRTQINGNFHNPAFLGRTAENIADALAAANAPEVIAAPNLVRPRPAQPRYAAART